MGEKLQLTASLVACRVRAVAQTGTQGSDSSAQCPSCCLKMSASTSGAVTQWSVRWWAMSGAEYVPWLENGNLFPKNLLNCKCRSRKRGVERAKKTTVAGIRGDQDLMWFKVIFSAGCNIFFWLVCNPKQDWSNLNYLTLLLRLSGCSGPLLRVI